jgi:hypothetical protein
MSIEVPSYAVFETAGARDTALPHPTRGQAAFLLDTGEVGYYYGGALGWRPAWNTAWGHVGMVTAVQAYQTGALQQMVRFPDLAVPFTPVQGRYYRAEFWANVDSGADGDIVEVDLSFFVSDSEFPNWQVMPGFQAAQKTEMTGTSPTPLYDFRVLSDVAEDDSWALPAGVPGAFILGAEQVSGTGGQLLNDTTIKVSDIGPRTSPQTF